MTDHDYAAIELKAAAILADYAAQDARYTLELQDGVSLNRGREYFIRVRELLAFTDPTTLSPDMLAIYREAQNWYHSVKSWFFCADYGGTLRGNLVVGTVTTDQGNSLLAALTKQFATFFKKPEGR
jgi:hypothetical protein